MASGPLKYDNRFVIFGLPLIIIAVVVFSLTRHSEVRQSLHSFPPAGKLPAELPIPETPWGQNSPEIQKHVQEVREKRERFKASPDVAPIPLANAYGELGEIYLTYGLPAGAIACF